MSGAVFSLQLKRFRLHAQLAVARSGLEVPPETLEAARLEIDRVTHALDQIRADAARPDLRLAAALGLSAEQLDFLWAVVARAADPLLLALLQVLCGTDARRGLSLSHYATIMGLDEVRSEALAKLLVPSNPLLCYRFLTGPEDQGLDACTPLTVPARVWSYLRGEDEVEGRVAAAGGRVHLPHAAQFDEAQQVALQRIHLALGSFDPMVIVVEGPFGAGRRTAIARAAAAMRRNVIAIDLSRIPASASALEATLAAQMRECLLADAIPVIAEADELLGGEGERNTRLHALARALETAPGPIAVTSQTSGLDLGVRDRRVLRIAWPVPSTAARRELWLAGARPTTRPGSNVGSTRSRSATGSAPGASRVAPRQRAPSRRPAARPPPLEVQDVVEGIRNNIAERLGELAPARRGQAAVGGSGPAARDARRRAAR